MFISQFSDFYVRELHRVREEITLYKNEALLWTCSGAVSNSAGNLCLHLIGNMNHFVGHAIGNTGYIRTRDLEFSSKNIPVASLLQQLDATIEVVKSSLSKLDDSYLEQIYPLDKHGEKVTYMYMLTHLLTHLNYHLGQINYHRRLIDC